MPISSFILKPQVSIFSYKILYGRNIQKRKISRVGNIARRVNIKNFKVFSKKLILFFLLVIWCFKVGNESIRITMKCESPKWWTENLFHNGFLVEKMPSSCS